MFLGVLTSHQRKGGLSVITKLEVFSAQPDAPELSLGGFYPNLDPVQVRDIKGLEPVKADIKTDPYASGDGELYNGSSVGKRNIVITLGLNPDWVDQTIASLRRQLYRYWLPKAWTKLRFFSDDMATVDIEGYVESFDPNMFSQDPEIQVSIICPKPDFIEPDATFYYGIVDDGTTELEFEYGGSAPAGFELRVQHSADNVDYTGSLDISMQQEPEDPQVFTVDPVTIDSTQHFKLSTIQNAKRVQQVSNADESVTNLLMRMTDASVWPQIKPGTNLFKVAATEIGQAWTLAFFNRYGGL
jgi:hypothetical protein